MAFGLKNVLVSLQPSMGTGGDAPSKTGLQVYQCTTEELTGTFSVHELAEDFTSH